jgi:hypothetical protein
MNTENQIAAQIQTTISDLKHAHRLYRAVITPDEYEGLIVVGILFGGGGLLLLGLAAIKNLMAGQPIDFSWWFVVLLILLVESIFDVLTPLRLWLGYRQNPEHYSQTYRVIFDDGGIAVHWQDVDAHYKWEYYKEAVEGSREFILVYGKRLYITIPKKAFRSESEIESFRNLLKRKVPKFKQKLKIWLDF